MRRQRSAVIQRPGNDCGPAESSIFGFREARGLSPQFGQTSIRCGIRSHSLSDPGVARTRDLHFRKVSLYPTELRGRWLLRQSATLRSRRRWRHQFSSNGLWNKEVDESVTSPVRARRRPSNRMGLADRYRRRMMNRRSDRGGFGTSAGRFQITRRARWDRLAHGRSRSHSPVQLP